MGKLSIKQLKRLRCGLTLLFIFLGFIAPILIICDKLDLVSEITTTKISWLAVVLVVSVAYVFRKNIIEYINGLEYSWFKSFVLGLSRVSFIVIILGLEIAITIMLKTASTETLQNFLDTLDAFHYCLQWWCILSITAHLGVRPFMDRCTHYIAKEARKNELREVLKE